MNVSVSARVRPYSKREIDISEELNANKSEWERKPLRAVVDFDGGNCTFHTDASDDVAAGSQVHDRTERFTFDNCFWSIPDELEKSKNPFAGQQEVFDGLGKPLLENCFSGRHTSLLHYGQTGAGKSYSMMGTDTDPGIIPRIGRRLFEMICDKSAEIERQNKEAAAAAEAEGGTHNSKTFRVQVTVRYLEIYNEMVKDLLWPMSTLSPEIKVKVNPENLKVRSSPATGVFAEHLTGVVVDSVERMLELIETGNSSRTVAATKMNERSSRSHAIFKVEVRQMTSVHSGKQFEKPTEHIRDATMNLVDLAGSERNKKTGATGDRLKEASNINKSLSCLKNVIDVLVENASLKPDRRKKPPYRDSTLTSLLADSLGGNSRTYMLVCLSPHTDNAEETLQTLKYGSKARQIVTTVHVNENAAGRMLLDMEEQLQKMRDQQSQLSFAQTAEGMAKMDVMKADIDEKTQMVNYLQTQIQKNTQAISDMSGELRQLNAGNAARALRNIQRATGPDREVRGEHARRYAECEARYNACRDELTAHKSRLAEGEFSVTQLENMIEANRAALDTSEVELDVVRRRNVKQDLSRRELVRNVQEQEQELSRLVHQRMTIVLSAKARILRLRTEHRNFLQQMEREHEKGKVDLLEQHRRNVDAERALTSKEIRDFQHRVDEMQKRLDGQEMQAEKVIMERQSQVEHLERDLEGLQRESARLKALGEKRLDHSKADWDQRDERGRQKTEATLEQMAAAHKEEYDSAVGHQLELEERRRAKWADEAEQNKKKVERLLAEAESARQAQVRKIEQDLGPALNEELRKCQTTVAELKQILEAEDEFAQLAHSLATNWTLFPQLKEAEEVNERDAASSRSASCITSPRTGTAAGGDADFPLSSSAILGGGVRSSSPRLASSSAVPEPPSVRSPSSASSASAAPPAPVIGRRTTLAGGGNLASNLSAQQKLDQLNALQQLHQQQAFSVARMAAASPSPPRPRSFFGQLAEFTRAREANQPDRYQIREIVSTAERLMAGAKDVSSVVGPVKL